MRDLQDLELLLASAIPIVVIETHEEPRVLELFRTLVLRAPRPLFHWTVTNGLQRVGKDMSPQLHNRKPDELLAQIKLTTTPGIYLLSDFHPYLDDPVHVRLLKDIALARESLGHTVVLVSHALDIPAEIERHCARFRLSVPSREELRELVFDVAREWAARNGGQNVTTRRPVLEKIIDNLSGLPDADAKRLARGAIEDDGALTDADLPALQQTKFRLLGRDGVLSFEYDTARFADVGGLARLKDWLALRKAAFTGLQAADGLDPPRGILLLGVQGCGKSLAAKAVAGSWGLPLLRLDFGTLYNKFHGETERNLRESLEQAESMAPCVLWMDEIEKGVATDTSDSGTSRRVLGTLLTWLNERKRAVFLVATANDIDSLPPELLRKGRVDEIFFVDLPDRETRVRILEIHLAKRDVDAGGIDTGAVADACEGFSGAEIEQAVVSALYTARARGATLDTALLTEEIARTRPLSVVMAERVAWLRAWARDRTVPAN
ncbi:MAG: AAA family ATPase [Gammaproteobacteria bacterium]|nr:AAA family ATPase [Gammaproteobacteria bacterium]